MNIKAGNTLPKEVLKAIRSVAGAGQISLHEPSFEGNEWKYLKECLDSSYVSSVGKFVDQFEKDLAEFTGAKHAISVVNGTAALHIALKLAGVEAGDEVLIPALTFVATANAVTYCNATPHFIDSEENTLGMNVNELQSYLSRNTSQVSGQCVNRKSGRVIRALIPMHTFGHPNDLDGLLAISNDFNIALVEDAAESLGSYFKGKHTGTFGMLGTLSFNGNKTITTGGGGAILTNDSELAKKAKHLTTTAKTSHVWEFRHDQVGFNYRMPNLNAALGCAQLEQLPGKLVAKRKLFKKYEEAFAKIEGIRLFAEAINCQSNYWLQTLILDKSQAHQRDLILEVTNKDGIMTRPAWELINSLPPYASCPSMELQFSNSFSKRLINIPSSPSIL